MEKLSHFLRQERERKGLSLQEVERELRIPLHYLEILEGTGDKRLLADPMYLIPSLRSYATFLDFDPAAVVTQFRVELQELQQINDRTANPERPFPVFKQPPRRFGVWSRLAVLVLALGILAFVGQFGDMAARWQWSTEGRVSPLSSSPEVPAAAEPWTPPSTSSSAPSVPPTTTGQSDTSPAPLAEPALVRAARQPEPSVPAAPQTKSVSITLPPGFPTHAAWRPSLQGNSPNRRTGPAIRLGRHQARAPHRRHAARKVDVSPQSLSGQP